MQPLIYRIRNLFSIRLPKVWLQGWLSVILVCGLTMALGSNLWRIAVNAQYNTEVYNAEIEGLEKLKSENDKLEDELDFYSSNEYRRVYIRDNRHLVESGNTQLYKVVDELSFAEPKSRLLNLNNVTADNWQWWRMFIP